MFARATKAVSYHVMAPRPISKRRRPNLSQLVPPQRVGARFGRRVALLGPPGGADARRETRDVRRPLLGVSPPEKDRYFLRTEIGSRRRKLSTNCALSGWQIVEGY